MLMPHNVIHPEIAAIIPLLANVTEKVADLYDHDFLDLDATRALVEDADVIKLRRLDDPANPLIKTDEKGNQTLVLLWGHPKNITDTDWIVGIQCALTQNQHGQLMFMPTLVMRGEKANVLIVGGMSCCGGAIQTHWSHILPEGAAIDEARMPEAGISHPEHNNWLQGKVYVANNAQAKEALIHMARDLLAHRLPNDPRFKHACSTTPDYLGYATKATAPSPMPR